ncbi:MAG: TolC family protein [Flavobacteriales bacterium]|nr:TolC family protein [Flavobacteriales bacterium]
MRNLLFLPLVAFAAMAQAQSDGPLLTRKALLQLVADNHPAARQAGLRNAMGEAVLRSARGAFDPVAQGGVTEKSFGGTEYYRLLDVGLRVPTWFGAEVFGGYSESDGVFLDPQNMMPSDGQLRLGASVQLGQGLFIDRRRAELRKAQAFQDMAEADRQRLLNEVFLEALSDHVDWVAAYRQLLVARDAVRQAEVRLTAVRGSFRGGDVPAIDTLEALLQVQDRRLRLQDAELAYRVSGLRLSNHLWDEALRPLEIAPSLLPDTNDLKAPDAPPPLDTLMARAVDRHPDLLEQQGRLRQLEVERRLRSEFLKPRLDLSHAFLAGGGVVRGEGTPTWNTADRQWGLGFSMPLFLRRERGELGLANLGLTDAELGLERQRLGIRNTIGRRYEELATLNRQVDLGAAMVRNYRALLAGENTRFAAGESSLFLVNQREVALLDSRIKQVELEGRLRKAFFILDRDAGILWQEVASQLTSN